MKNHYVSALLFFFALVGGSVQAQSVITGRVIDSDTKESLPGVTVLIKGKDTGEFTDSNGKFVIRTQSLPVTLAFSFIGFETKGFKNLMFLRMFFLTEIGDNIISQKF